MESKLKVYRLIRKPSEHMARFLFGYQVGDIVKIAPHPALIPQVRNQKALVCGRIDLFRNGSEYYKCYFLSGPLKGEVRYTNHFYIKLIGRVINVDYEGAAAAIGRTN